MEIFIAAVLIVIGFVLLIKGADFLIDGSSNLAKRLHIPEIVIGLTIVSMGTSMPELMVSTTSALEGFPDMAIGNVVGSSICNLLLILGLSATVKNVKFHKQTQWIEIPFATLIAILFMWFGNTNGQISKKEAGVLVILFLVFLMYTIVIAIKEKKEEEQKEREEEEIIDDTEKKELTGNIFKDIFYILLGILGLKFGGDFAVDNSVVIANAFNVSEVVISLTILAIGTSLPELVTTVKAALKGNSDIAIGNIIGSNIFNILLIIGITGLIRPITYNVSYNVDMMYLIISTALLLIFSITKPKGEMNKVNGILYLLMYGVYMGMLFQK